MLAANVLLNTQQVGCGHVVAILGLALLGWLVLEPIDGLACCNGFLAGLGQIGDSG